MKTTCFINTQRSFLYIKDFQSVHYRTTSSTVHRQVLSLDAPPTQKHRKHSAKNILFNICFYFYEEIFHGTLKNGFSVCQLKFLFLYTIHIKKFIHVQKNLLKNVGPFFLAMPSGSEKNSNHIVMITRLSTLL